MVVVVVCVLHLAPGTGICAGLLSPPPLPDARPPCSLVLVQGSASPTRERIALALTHLVTKDSPSGENLRTMFREKKGLDILLPLVASPPADAARVELQRQAAMGLNKMAEALGMREMRSGEDIAPPEPNRKVFLGAQARMGWGQGLHAVGRARCPGPRLMV